MSGVHVGEDFVKNFGRLMWKTMVQWLQLNTGPDYIYEPKQIVDCAITHYREMLYEKISWNSYPGSVFSSDVLEDWALANGFVRAQ